MTKGKKNQQSGLSTGGIIAIVFGAIVITAIIVSAITGNISSDDYEEYSPPVYTEQEEAKENEFFNGNNFFEEDNDFEYEQSDAKWVQYVNLIDSDDVRLDNVYANYCSGDMTDYQLEQCVNQISPALSYYATHIQNAQNFMETDGQIFGNNIELLGYLDDKAIYVQAFTNQINTAVNAHNARQTSNSEIISDDELMDILKILAMVI